VSSQNGASSKSKFSSKFIILRVYDSFASLVANQHAFGIENQISNYYPGIGICICNTIELQEKYNS
jgi:hypothetical protein